MTGIQEILRVFFFSLLLLHDLMLAFSCTVLCSSSLLLGNLGPFPFQHLDLNGCAKKMKLTKPSINSFSTCWLQRACYCIKYTLPPHFFLLHVLRDHPFKTSENFSRFLTPLPSTVFYYYSSVNMANFWPLPPKKCRRLNGWSLPSYSNGALKKI